MILQAIRIWSLSLKVSLSSHSFTNTSRFTCIAIAFFLLVCKFQYKCAETHIRSRAFFYLSLVSAASRMHVDWSSFPSIYFSPLVLYLAWLPSKIRYFCLTYFICEWFEWFVIYYNRVQSLSTINLSLKRMIWYVLILYDMLCVDFISNSSKMFI